MSFARQILYEIAGEIGKPREAMNKFIGILEENMCDTEIALKSTSTEELNELGLPKFIALKLTKKLKIKRGCLPNNFLKKSKKGNKMILEENNIIENNKIPFLDKILKELFLQYISNQEKFNSLNLLNKILKNILKNPTSEKFRKLNKGNNKLYMNLWKFHEIHDLFKHLNFNSKENFFFLQQKEIKNNYFNYIIKKIENELSIVEKKLNNGFNPFKPSFRTNNPNFDIKVVGELAEKNTSDYFVELQKLKKERENLIKNHKVKRNVKIYKRETKMIIENEEDKVDEKIVEIDEKEIERKEQALLLRKRFLNFQKNFYKEISFSNSRKKEFDEITKKNLNLETIIKIKLPNRFIIEANFHVNDKLESVFAVLKENLIKKEGYFLFVAPFVKNKLEFKDSKKTLSELSLVPNANLNLLFREEGLNKEKSTFLLKELF